MNSQISLSDGTIRRSPHAPTLRDPSSAPAGQQGELDLLEQVFGDLHLGDTLTKAEPHSALPQTQSFSLPPPPLSSPFLDTPRHQPSKSFIRRTRIEACLARLCALFPAPPHFAVWQANLLAQPSSSAWNDLLKRYANAPAGVDTILAAMADVGEAAGRGAYTTLLKGQLATCDLKAAKATWQRMEAAGVMPNVATYTLMMNAYIKARQFEEVPNLLGQIDASGLKLDLISCNTLLKACAAQKPARDDAALKIYRYMQREKIPCDVITFTTLMNVLGRAGKADHAHFIFITMQELGVEPDIVTYGVLIETYRTNMRPSDALALYGQMETAGLVANTIICNIVLRTLTDIGDIHAAMAYWHNMQRIPGADRITYDILLSALTKNRLWDEASQVLSAAAHNNFRLDSKGCLPVLQALAQNGHARWAYQLCHSLLPWFSNSHARADFHRLVRRLEHAAGH